MFEELGKKSSESRNTKLIPFEERMDERHVKIKEGIKE